MPPITTFVFFDIETTGLPHLEKNQTKITELSMVAASKDDILNTSLGYVPKVTKLSLLFNPERRIHPDAVKMNGLSNNILKSEPIFREKFDTINSFLLTLAKPVCLIAHNGNNFDYKILLAECNDGNLNLSLDLLCYDSIVAFRNILGGTNISFETLSKKIDEKDNVDATVDVWPELDLSIEDIEQLDLSVTETLNDEQKKKKTRRKKASHKKLTKKLEERNNLISTLFTKSDNQCNRNSFKLAHLYKRLLNKSPENCHRAEADCFMLLECVVALKTEFIKLAESESILLNDIQALIRY
ncbi:Three prime repair exonuclease 2 [Eumeta japonica]|uniref:Three prime repair exonuclease 2 n=1 Tax=Eumeta variegata TaxID=151549 RepID=A0A4C1WYS1_EUMVA|nr:Three prime repair exonuclease 2 [Eumeta japonica]